MKNVHLLRIAQEKIREEPRRLDMGAWLQDPSETDVRDNPPPCGAVGCIAGWVWVANGGTMENFPFSLEVRDLLGLDLPQENRLFFTDEWPEDLEEAYNEAKPGSIERAEITCERIDRFIASEGES